MISTDSSLQLIQASVVGKATASSGVMMKRVVRAAVLGILQCILVACGGGGGDDIQPGDPVPRQGALRVLNAIPDAGFIDGYLSGSLVSHISYADASPLAKTIVGRYTMTVLAPTRGGPTDILVNAEPVDLTQQDEVSLLMIGPFASATLLRIDNIEIDFGVDLTQPALFPQPDYQIVHAATDTDAVDVYVTEQNVDINTVSPSATVSFGDVTPLADLDSTVTYRLRVTTAGTKTVLFDSGPYTQAKLIRAMYLLLDSFGPGGETLRVADVLASGLQNFPKQLLVGTMRVANMIPDSGAVDVYLGPTTNPPLFANVPYGTVTGYLQVPPDTVTVNVTAAGSTAVLYQVDITPVGGEARTFYVSGTEATPTSLVSRNVLESLRPITQAAQFAIVAAAPSAGSVDIYLTAAGQPITDVAPILTGALLANNLVAVGTGDYDVTVTRAGSTVALFGPTRVSLDAGNVYDSVIFDSPGGGSPLQFTVAAQALP
jgi:hypothetical protein